MPPIKRNLPFAAKAVAIVVALSIVGNGIMNYEYGQIISNNDNPVAFDDSPELPGAVDLAISTNNNTTIKKKETAPSVPFRDLVSDTTTKDLAVADGISNNNNKDPLLFCDGISSAAWRNSTRISNIPIPEAVADQLMDPNHLKHVDFLTGQTMCLRDGPFRHQKLGKEAVKLEHWNSTLKAWEFKLTYLAIHALFHEPAQEEYKARKQCANIQEERKTNSGGFLPSYEYECPKAKYLVTRFSGVGFGASVRAGVMNVLVASLIHNRIPVFIGNKVPRLAAEKFRRPNDQFSCSDRKDYQCLFMPLSPCTPRLADIVNGTGVTVPYGKFLYAGRNPEKVLVMGTQTIPMAFETRHPAIVLRLRKKIHDKVVELINTWASSTSVDTDDDKHNHLKLLNSAAEQILSPSSGSESSIYQPFFLYMMRPNPITKEKMEAKIIEIMPSEQSMDPKLTLGMPIRGSDKCNAEATCLPFANYMELANETGTNDFHLKPLKRKGHLILTTEDRTLFDQRHNYSSAKDFPFDFVVNEEDTFQGTGRATLFAKIADEVILGSMITMQMQMHAGYVIGNCCSNFHNLLFSFLQAGCGRAEKLLCMQDITNPRYKICCRSNDSEECEAIKSRFAEEKENFVGLLEPYKKIKRPVSNMTNNAQKNE